MKTYMLGFTKEGEALLRNRFEHLGPIMQDTLRRILQNDAACQSASLAKGEYLYIWYGEYSALWQALGEVLEPVSFESCFYAGWIGSHEHSHFGRLDLTATFGLSVQFKTHFDKNVDVAAADGMVMADRLIPPPPEPEVQPAQEHITSGIDSELW